MVLLTKIDETEFEFDKILASGYTIDEQPDLIAKKKFVNGNRKKITTEYTDVVIEIDIGCFDGDTLATYLSKLTDGEYKYYSLNDKIEKNANFIVTLPSQTIESASGDVIIGDFTVLLEKSSDVSEVSL